MTEAQMKQARARLDAATPGPWYHGDGLYAPFGVHGRDPDIGHIWVADAFVDGPHNGGADSVFIAAAPTDLRLALDALDRVRAAIGENTLFDQMGHPIDEAVNHVLAEITAALDGTAPASGPETVAT